MPGVSILKPLIGFDRNLKVCLESYFKLTYPKYEIVFCIAEKEDPPSLPLVKELVELYPQVDVQIIIGAQSIGVNPKINNSARGYESAKYDLIWFSDANILTKPYTLTEMVSKILHKDVGLVHQIPYIINVQTFGECLNKVYFGSQHARLYLAANFCNINCTTGMSMLAKKKLLDNVGGLAVFREYLAEDYFIAKAIKDSGAKIVLSSFPALQNPGQSTFTSYRVRLIRCLS
jgi:ceramide glucosyltransferase